MKDTSIGYGVWIHSTGTVDGDKELRAFVPLPTIAKDGRYMVIEHRPYIGKVTSTDLSSREYSTSSLPNVHSMTSNDWRRPMGQRYVPYKLMKAYVRMTA